MYNEMQKSRYINSDKLSYTEDVKNVIRSLFNSAERVEIQEKSDLSNFTKSQIVNLFKSFNAGSRNYLKTVAFYFNEYYMWCQSEGLLDSSNVLNYYDAKLIKPIIEMCLPLSNIAEKYISEPMMKEYVENRDVDIVSRFIMYAIFLGIYGQDLEELKYLKIEDLNKNEKTVKLSTGRIVVVDDIFIDLMEKANAEEYYYADGENLLDTPYASKYSESIYVIKLCRQHVANEVLKPNVVYARFKKIQENLNNSNLTPANIYKSGLIKYVNRNLMKHGLSLKDIVGENKSVFTHGDLVEKLISEFGSDYDKHKFRREVREILDYINI